MVSEWHDELVNNLFSTIDPTNHPFSNIVVMIPHDISSKSLRRLLAQNSHSKVSVKFHKRKNDKLDICNAPVETAWFMITNSYHVVSDKVDLIFSNDKRALPVIPYTHTSRDDCFKISSCRAILENANTTERIRGKMVLDFDLLFQSKLRDDYCGSLDLERNKMNKVRTTLPSAMSYLSYLDSSGILNEYYRFIDTSIYSRRGIFERRTTIKEESKARHGETVVANKILRRAYTDQARRWKQIQLVPSFSPPKIVDPDNPVQDPPSKSPNLNVEIATDPPSKSPNLNVDLITEAPSKSPNLNVDMITEAPSKSPSYEDNNPTIDTPSKSPNLSGETLTEAPSNEGNRNRLSSQGKILLCTFLLSVILL